MRVMNSSARLLDLSRRLAGLVRDRRGVSAVEFAMILPLMVTLYLGTAEVTQGVSIDRKVTITAHTLADLVSQFQSITNADMTNVLAASAAVISPYDSTKLTATVTAITIDANGTAKVAWSDSYQGTAHSVGSAVTVPTAIKIPSTQLIWSEVNYLYKPTIGYIITGTLNLADTNYTRPRLSDTVTRVP
jgi:Flp pilus assembly protein TadG